MSEKTQKEKPARKSARTAAADTRGATKERAPAEGVRKKPAVRASRKPAVAREEIPQRMTTLITFSLEAPAARNVCVAGCFNGWDPLATPLKRNEQGVWTCAIGIEPGEHQYRFVVDGEWWDDPLNGARCWNEFGTQNCMLTVKG